MRERLYEHAAAVLAQADGGTAAPMSARHVRVELHGSARTLTLAEVEVFSGGANVAPLGTATQSTVNWGGTPDRAIDGNRSGSWSDGGQTHTMEDRPDPWWELDLGREVPIEEIVIWNRTDGDWGRRLDDVVVKLRDAQGVWVAETGVVGEVEAHHRFSLWSSHADLVRRAAVGAIAGIDLDSDRSARILAGALADPVLRGTAVSALRTLPMDAWADATRAELARLLLSRFDAAPEDDFLLPGGRELLVLVDELAPHLTAEPDLAARLLEERRKLGPQAFVIRPIRDAMVYDVTAFSVVAGKPVELVFDNVDIMPHNLLVTAPGALALVGQAGEAMAREADGVDRGFVPALDEVLVASRLLQPGQRQTLSFTAPAEPGSYPYVCTFPGHWVRMNGIMTVVASWDELGGPVEASVNATDEGAAPARPFVRSWTADEFHGALEALDTADAERGRALVEEASCLRCHAVDGEGGITGPDLRDAVARLETPEALLAHLIDPSLEIREGYESELFFTTDGGVVAGRVMGEEPGLLLIQDDPYRDDVLELPLADIEERRPADLSLMPAGLLSTLQRDEILDLLAFLESLREE